jgi:hypothetical protein
MKTPYHLFLIAFMVLIAFQACKTTEKLDNKKINKKAVLSDSVRSNILVQNKQLKTEKSDSVSNQNKSKLLNDTTIFYLVDDKPQFPGGEIELNAFISKNMDYKGVGTIEPWGIALVKFVVSIDGKTENIQIINKDKIPDIIEERIINVIRSFPNFTPGRIKGRPVSSWKIIKINEPN